MILFVPDVYKGALCQNHFRKGKDKDLPSRDGVTSNRKVKIPATEKSGDW